MLVFTADKLCVCAGQRLFGQPAKKIICANFYIVTAAHALSERLVTIGSLDGGEQGF